MASERRAGRSLALVRPAHVPAGRLHLLRPGRGAPNERRRESDAVPHRTTRASSSAAAPVGRRATELGTPLAEASNSVRFEQARRFRADVSRHPPGKRNLLGDVAPGGRVYFMDLGKALPGKALRRANERRPQAPMNEGDLAIDESADEDVVAPANALRELEDFVAPRMRPPTPLNRFARDGDGK